MTRLIPVLIVAAILALIASVGADTPAAPVPASATTETGGGDARALSPEHETRAVAVAAARTETSREKARRIITATWPKTQVANAMRVVECESGFNQWAANLRDYHSDGSRGSYGWFQVGAIWRHDPEVKGNVARLYLPWTNARVAYRIWKRQGWWAWRNCAMRAGLL